MSNVLKIKNEHGAWVYIPAITGPGAYEIALENGYIGTEEEWLESLRGYTPIKGIDYFTEEDISGVVDLAKDEIQPDIHALQNGKVDKESGKGLSANDYTDSEKAKLAVLENYDDSSIIEDISALQNSKVDKEDGKGLSTNDYTTEEKEKLASLVNYDDTTIQMNIDAVSAELGEHKADSANPHGVTKLQIGLGNVDNTSDMDKPMSTATKSYVDSLAGDIETALDSIIDIQNSLIGGNA